MPRKIIHMDLDAFFCAVEELLDPSLRGKAFAVGGSPNERGVVASCSYAARRFGVRSAMPMARAVRICPGLKIVHSQHRVYSQYSHQVMDILRQVTPLLEQVSIDEAFLDVSDLPESGERIALQLQQDVHEKVNLPCSFGIASNKLVAKIATDAGKSAARGAGPPNAITVVPAGEEALFLAPLPVQALWGVGPKTGERLEAMNIRTIGDLAAYPAHELVRLFGKNGRDLVQRALGIDDSPISTSHEVKSISQETTFSRDVRDAEQLHKTLKSHTERVGKQLRRSELFASTVKIKLRWSDFSTITRQMKLEAPTDQDEPILAAARLLFEKNWPQGRAVRLIGVGVSDFCTPVRQLSLWEAPMIEKEEVKKLKAAIEELQQKYGRQSIRVGKELKRG